MNTVLINELKRFAQGKMSLSDFEVLQANHPEIWTWLQSLLTEEMIGDPGHEFWKKCQMRLALEANTFKVRATATAFGFEGFAALSRIHHLVSTLVSTQYPEIRIKQPPSYSMLDFLCDIGLECIGGPEADELVKSVIDSLPDELNLRERKKQAKRRLKALFGITGKKPVWIQEPEWPVMNGSPLRFVSQEQSGELVSYRFIDDSSGEQVIIEQFA